MRTTVTLDPDVAAAVAEMREDTGVGVSAAVNALARRGLAVREAPEPFVQETSAMGVPLIPLDSVADAIEVLEGADAR